MKKNIYIHVGPPKTGTSAIQNWMTKNTEVLKKNGILYPEHSLDSNGISSGNLLEICDIINKPDGEVAIQLNEEKFESLRNNFLNSDYKTLILSSEFFIQHMIKISELCNDITFIAYIRDPIDIMESNYNQGVKRSNFTHKIDTSSFSAPHHLSFLHEYLIKKDPNKLILRHYDTVKFYDKSLIEDLTSLLGLEIQENSSKVNTSYCQEALEFKRWLNQYAPQDLQPSIDQALQSFKGGTINFTLVEDADLINAIDISRLEIEKLASLSQSKHFRVDENYLNSIGKRKGLIFKTQKIEKEDFEEIVKFLKVKLGSKFNLLRQKLNTVDSNDEKLIWFKESSDSILNSITSALKKFKTTPLKDETTRNIEIGNLREVLEIPEHIEEADILRELSILSYKNGYTEFAITLMKNAARIRPNGAAIKELLEKYKNETN